MNEAIDFTPKELYTIGLYKDPADTYSKSVSRGLGYILPSAAIIAYGCYCDEIIFALVGYGILLFQAVKKLILAKRGLQTMSSIIHKYEAKLQSKSEGKSEGK